MESTYRDKLNNITSIYKYSVNQLSKHKKELAIAKRELFDHKRVRETFQLAAVNTQTYLEKHLSLIVTNALQSVFFDEDYEFVVKFDKKRNSTECSLTLLDDGEEYDIMDDKGFGVADIASFSLRVAYVLLDSTDNVLILDEPFRNLDKERIPHASKMVHELSHKLNIQFIVVTHINELADYADSVFRTVKVKKLTEVHNESI